MEVPLPPVPALPNELWKHQREAKLRAENLDYFGLFFEVGTGKTRTVIEMLEDKFFQNGRVLRTLIFTPLVVVENFKREIQKYGLMGKYAAYPLTGKMKDRVHEFELHCEKPSIFITNYEALYHGGLMNKFLNWNPEVFVTDEIHKLKDPKAKRTRAAQQISNLCKYRFGLSGTPILNSQLDLFSQIRILDHGKTFGDNFFIHRSRYFYDANASRRSNTSYFPCWLPRPSTNEELKEAIAPFTMSVKKSEALDLPPFLRKDVIVEMGEAQNKAYKSMKKDFIAFLNDRACVAQLALTKALRLAQIVSGFIKLEDETSEFETVFSDVPRLKALSHLLEEITPNHKVIVWAAFKKNYQMISETCDILKIKYAMLHGETNNKQAEIDRFQNDETCRVMIANPAAGGIGISLVSASYMIYYSKSFSLEHDLQSEARAHRGGSEIHDKVTRIDLVCPGTIDEIITNSLASKKQIGDAVIDSKEIVRILKREL